MRLFGTKIYIASAKELENEEQFIRLYQTVSKERQQKIDRLRFSKDKRLSLAAELLLKKALKEIGINEHRIEYGENGKPYLKDISEVYFNLSHSEERVMCVISEKEVGCDVEKIRDTDFRIAGHFLTDEEQAFLEQANNLEEKKELFFRLWTLKESFLKATGMGMKLSMKDFMFQFVDNQVYVCQTVNGEQYFFEEYDFQDGYRYAVCSLCPGSKDWEEKFVEIC